jgi:hypothetical protein
MRYCPLPCAIYPISPRKLQPQPPHRRPTASPKPPGRLLHLDLSWVLVLASLKLNLTPFGNPANQRDSSLSSPVSPHPVTASHSTCWSSRARVLISHASTLISCASTSSPFPLLVLLVFGLGDFFFCSLFCFSIMCFCFSS